MATALPSFPSFDPSYDVGAPGPRWEKYVSRFRNLLVAVNITAADRQRALLLHYIGESVNDIFDTLTVPAALEGETALDTAINALTNYFEPKRNIVFEEYKFRQAQQERGESIMSFHSKLKYLAKTCNFADVDREVKTQIVHKCASNKVRRKGLNDSTITLQGLLDFAKTLELTDSQAASLEEQAASDVMKQTTADVKKLHLRKDRNGSQKKHKNWKGTQDGGSRTKDGGSQKRCINCGGPYPHEGGKKGCPAFGKECHNCGKMNHYKSVCRGQAKPSSTSSRREVKALHDTSDDEEYDIFTLMNKTTDKKHPVFEVSVEGERISIMADSGSTICVLDEKDYDKVGKPLLQETAVRVYPYQSEKPIEVLGKFQATMCTDQGAKCHDTMYVVKGQCGSLLSWQASQKLSLIKVVSPLQEGVRNSEVDDIVREHKHLFEGLGKLKDFQVKLHIDETVRPVAQPHRRVPFHVRKQLEEQLQKDEGLGVIEPTEGPTPWVSPIVIAPKPKQPGQIRVCVDMRQANQAVERERHVTPTIKEVIGKLNGAKYFSKLDLNQGYNQRRQEDTIRQQTRPQNKRTPRKRKNPRAGREGHRRKRGNER